METISIKLEEEFAKDVEKIMKKNRYSTKTEFIREAIRDKMKDLEKEEALLKIKTLYGYSKRKTNNEQLHDAREKAFNYIEN